VGRSALPRHPPVARARRRRPFRRDGTTRAPDHRRPRLLPSAAHGVM
jgi:hypothetical protein